MTNKSQPAIPTDLTDDTSVRRFLQEILDRNDSLQSSVEQLTQEVTNLSKRVTELENSSSSS